MLITIKVNITFINKEKIEDIIAYIYKEYIVYYIYKSKKKARSYRNTILLKLITFKVYKLI